MPDTLGRKITVGRVTGVFGIQGWVKIHSHTEPPDNIFKYQPWCLRADTIGTTEHTPSVQITVCDYRPHGKGHIAKLNGIDTREQAEVLCRHTIETALDQLPPLPEGEFYWQQLIGLAVYHHTDDQDVLLGVVSNLMETGANDVMEVTPCAGSLDQRTRLLPYVPDVHVTNIDIPAGRITVDWDPAF